MQTRRGPAEVLLVGRSSPLLFSGLATCATAFREGEVVAVVALCPDLVIQLEGPVLSPGKAAYTVEHDVFSRGELTCTETQTFMKEQTMSTESFDEVLDGGVRDVE
jgi:hypothetical protein